MNGVLLTGTAGTIGTSLRERLPGFGWDVRSFDEALRGRSAADALARAMAGVGAIAHFAEQPEEAPWPAIDDANIQALVALFEAARQAGVRRIVYASSSHAVGYTSTSDDLRADLPPRPDTLYGVSKVFGEALARYYVDRYGMQVACLRIGTFAQRPGCVRDLSTWLSPADCARLVDACLRTSALRYAIVWGVSANTRRTWSLAAGEALGYEPRDDAEVYAAQVADPLPHPSDAFVGGAFTDPEFGQDEVRARWSSGQR